MSPPPNAQRGAADIADEAALVARLKAGDRAAFAALVDRHGGPLLRLAVTFTRDRALAEEAVQETWLAALDGLDGFEARSSVRSWLFGILANKARTRFTRELRSVPFSALQDRGEGDDPGPDPFDQDGAWRHPPGPWSGESPERLAQRAETLAAIEAAIASLPDAQRAVITLRDVEELESEEICSLLGITLTNQRVLLHRARARVRLALEGERTREG